MAYILSILKLVLPYLNLLEYLLRNLDSNEEGIDDKAADGIREGVRLLLMVANDDMEQNPSNVAKGLAGITAYGNNVLAALDQLLVKVETATPDEKATIIVEAEALVSSLSDSTKVYQAQRGDDANALMNFKVEAGKKLLAIKGQ